ncbi:MAG: sigma-70 family RNA polymerase sigma factor [Lachnospiraceae bacterium]
MNTFPQPLSAEEESHYLAVLKDRAKKDSEQERQKARHQLIEHNMRLVAHIARKFQNADSGQSMRFGRDYYSDYILDYLREDLDDLISVGTIGLIKAIDTYDASKGSKLVTYASRCIENELLMLMRSKKKSAKDISLYEPLGTDKDGNEINLLDICDSNQETIDHQLEIDSAYRRLAHFIGHGLTSRERLIIYMRYGFEPFEEMTQKEIGQRLGISRSYVSRIEKRALLKLWNLYETEDK